MIEVRGYSREEYQAITNSEGSFAGVFSVTTFCSVGWLYCLLVWVNTGKFKGDAFVVWMLLFIMFLIITIAVGKNSKRNREMINKMTDNIIKSTEAVPATVKYVEQHTTHIGNTKDVHWNLIVEYDDPYTGNKRSGFGCIVTKDPTARICKDVTVHINSKGECVHVTNIKYKPVMDFGSDFVYVISYDYGRNLTTQAQIDKENKEIYESNKYFAE